GGYCGAAPCAGAAACLSEARATSSGVGGSCCVVRVARLATVGSSRSFTYNRPLFGCGTGNEYPGKPSGTCTACAKSASLDTESTRNRLEPDSLQASSAAAGHLSS